MGVVRGALTGPNILLADNGPARLIDFGFPLITPELQGSSYITLPILGGSMRWAAPELPRLNAAPEVRMEAPVDLTGKIDREENPCARGGFADVWRGEWQDADGKRHVMNAKDINYMSC